MFDWKQSQKFLSTFEKLVKALSEPQMSSLSWEQRAKDQDRKDEVEDLALWRGSVLALLANPNAISITGINTSVERVADCMVAGYARRRAEKRKLLDDKEY